MDNYQIDNSIKGFFKEYRWLSNFHPCTIEYESIIYPSVEHAYQACKSTNVSVRDYISKLSHPGLAKKFGRQIIVRYGWEGLRVGVMEALLVLKFHHPYLKDLLIGTGDRQLIEVNWWGDKFWGVRANDSVGLNHLGKLLMKVRSTL